MFGIIVYLFTSQDLPSDAEHLSRMTEFSILAYPLTTAFRLEYIVLSL